VQSFAAGGNVTLHNLIPPALPPILADDERLYQILLNLLTNAIKFTPPGGQVGVSARLSALSPDAPPDSLEPPPPPGPPHSVEITVQDTGIGLVGDQAIRVWERFYQADSTSRRSYDRAARRRGLGHQRRAQPGHHLPPAPAAGLLFTARPPPPGVLLITRHDPAPPPHSVYNGMPYILPL
jgi:two-component system sensor histidine kinase BaeS